MSFLPILTKNNTLIIYSCRAYVELDDEIGKLGVIMFGKLAKEALGCLAIDFMNYTREITLIIFTFFPF